MDCEPYVGELVAAKASEAYDKKKYILGMIMEIKTWEHEEKYSIQWFDDFAICDYNEYDYQVFRDRMAKVRREYGL